MPDISSVGHGPLSPLSRTSSGLSDSTRTSSTSSSIPGRIDTSQRVDRVEVSEQARYLAAMKSMPDARLDLIERVKAQIARGTYDTPQKLDAALDHMIDELA
jgi:anti-sigma28 factor (negative regulator of flagellin synthesis)